MSSVLSARLRRAAIATRDGVSSFWYPSVSVTGAYLHMANRIEVEQPLSQFTDPAKDFIHSILPDDQIISGLLDHVGTYTLRFPLAPQDVATIDANVTWPVGENESMPAGSAGRWSRSPR